MKIKDYFTIIFPTFNNLKYLKLFYKSLRENSFDKEIPLILFINEGSDGTLEWVKQHSDIKYIHATENQGIAKPMNEIQKLVETEWTLLFADDIYLLPNWDQHLFAVIKHFEFNDNLWVAPRLIEPINCFAPIEHPYCSIGNYGQTIDEFEEEKLLSEYKKFNTTIKHLPNGNMAIKSSIYRDLNGYDEEFIYGSDSDFTCRFCKLVGTKGIKQVGSSLAYHFGSIVSNANIEKKQKANKQSIELFQKKHGFFVGDLTKKIQNNEI